MRLAACALSAVLLSGCSWLGSGGSYGDSYGYESNGAYSNGAYGGGCMQGAQGAAYSNMNYGYSGGQQGGQGCAPGAGYNVAYGAGGGGYGAGSGGLRGFQGAGMYGAGAGGSGMYGAGAGGSGMYGAGVGGAGIYGAGAGGSGMYGAGTGMYGAGSSAYSSGVTTLGGAAPYGSAVGGAGVTTVQGAPIYVAQPYPAYYAAGGGAQYAGGGSQYSGGYNYGYSGGGYNYGGGGSLPFGLELGLGQDFHLGGDIFPGEVSKTFAGGTGTGTVSDLSSIKYSDAWDNAKSADLTATYDVNANTTLLGRVGYSKADGGNQVLVGSITDAGVTEDLYAEFSDLEQYTVEGGIRHYMGAPTGLRPYVGATAGFAHTKDISLTQSSDTFVDPAIYTQNYVDGGWAPTASGVIGAEWAVGGRAALGVETGIRWTDDLDSNFASDPRLSVPVKLRGRVSF